jgi:hypothetical protein
VSAAREAWFAGQPDLDPEQLIFIDETGLNTKMARLRGRCARGERLFAPIPHGHWRTTTWSPPSQLSPRLPLTRQPLRLCDLLRGHALGY